MHCFLTRLPGAATRIPMKKKPIVDLDLQRSRHGGRNAKSGWNTSRVKKCTCSSWPAGSFTGSQGQGGSCSCWGRDIYGTLCKEVADQRGHLPAQATSTLAGCERPAWARKGRRRHGGLLHGGRDRMRGWEGQVVSPLSHIFLRNFTGPCGLVFVCLVGCVVFLFVLVCFFWDGLVKFCTQLAPVHFKFPVVDRLCFALARQCRKKKISTWFYSTWHASMAIHHPSGHHLVCSLSNTNLLFAPPCSPVAIRCLCIKSLLREMVSHIETWLGAFVDSKTVNWWLAMRESLILHSISTCSFRVSSSWPTMLRARSAMQEKKLAMRESLASDTQLLYL